MNNEPNKPIPAQELTEKELEGIAGGVNEPKIGIKIFIGQAGASGDRP